jgi:hypothetical protein
MTSQLEGGMMKRFIRAVQSLALLAVLLTGIAARAQNTNSGDIRGIVTDPTGAAISGATIVVKDVDKGIEKTYVTDSAGLYDSGPIIPDHYLITVSAPGFQTFIRGPITLSVGQVTVNAPLTIGTAESQIVVKDELPQLNTESGAQSASVDSTALTQIPQVGADWQNVAVLLPGVAVNTGVAAQTTSVNGNQPYNSTLVNGANATLPMSQNTDVAVLETVAELKVDSSAFSAQNGTGGIVFNQITKSGSNQFHGSAYEHAQNDALNAYDYQFSDTKTKSVIRYHNFGGAIGGPILRNKLFFYFNYDRINEYGGASTGFMSLPTQAMTEGDFTGLPTIYDPTTQTVDSTTGAVTRTSFAEEYGNGNVIPSSQISSLAKALQAYYPTINATSTSTSGLPQNNYSYNIPNNYYWNKYFGRLDWDVTSNNRLTISEIAQSFVNTTRAVMCDIQCQKASVEPNFAQITDVWTISPTLLNEFRIGYAHELDFYVPDALGKGFPTTLGWKFSKADLPPTININSLQGFYPASNSVYKEFAFDPSDVVTLIKGRHVLHFGGEVLINRADSTAWGNINAGSMSFTGAYTESANGDTTTGIGYADFLLGYANSWSASVTPEYGGRLKIPQAFVQDDFKVKPTLTVNLGLRWQGMSGWHEVKNNMRTFDPTVMNTATNTLGALWFGSTKANGRDSLQKPIWDMFMPRIGASWQIRPDTVIRGGIGLYAYTWSIDTYGSGMGSELSSSGSLSDKTNGSLPVVLLDSDGTTNYQGSYGKSIASAYTSATTDPTALNGQDVGYGQYEMPVGKSLQWNVDIQHQFQSDLSGEIAYVGNHSYDLPFDTNLNQVPESKLSSNDSADVPYTQYGSIGGRKPWGLANYHSLQLSVDKRMSHDLQFNANYVWSHMLDNASSAGWNTYNGGSYWQRAYDPDANYGASNYDHRHVVKGSVIYTLPFGSGHRWASRNRAVNEAIGGWQPSLTVLAQTGRPFTVYMATDNSYALHTGVQFPNMVSKWKKSNAGISGWYDVDAFGQPTAGTFGNNHRNNVYGPGMSQVNLSFGKIFSFTDKIKFQLRADASNVLNHPSWGLPDQAIGDGHTASITSLSVYGRTMQIFGRFSF